MRRPIAVMLFVAGLPLLYSGCIVTFSRQTTTRTIGARLGAPRPGPADLAMTVDATAAGRVIVLATWRRTCTRKRHRVVQEETGLTPSVTYKVLEIPVVNVFALALSPFTMGASGLVYVIAAASDDAVRSRRLVPAGAVRSECSIPAARVTLTAAFPSGVVAEAVSDARGAAAFGVPATEPEAGPVRISAANHEPVWGRYYRARAACLLERDRAMAGPTAPGMTADRLEALADLPVCPASEGATAAEVAHERADERAWRLTRRAAMAAWRGDCGVTHALEPTVSAVAPRHHAAVFSREPAIARCLTERRSCVARRAEIGRRAARLSDLKARVALLKGMPSCPR